VGKRFHDNDELKEALGGKIIIEYVTIAADMKSEHVGLARKVADADRFVEEYLPIRDEAGKNIIAVIEIYKIPRALFLAIDEGVYFVWASVAIGGILLYLAFFWIGRRADVLMREQRERLVEAETLTAMGEMAAAIAHGIRNPLASIRSAAEIAREEDRAGAQECLQDIMAQTDRLDGWVRELLAASRGSGLPIDQVDLNSLIRESLEGAASELRRQGIELSFQEAVLPPVRGSRAPLAHAFSSIISNAIEAMPQGGRLRVESRMTDKGLIAIAVEDTGVGMPPRVARRAFRPLFTTKPNGVGLGLSLARRIVERHAGRIDLDSVAGHGTRVVLTLPTGA
jgi:signal transduction histidine kinase